MSVRQWFTKGQWISVAGIAVGAIAIVPSAIFILLEMQKANHLQAQRVDDEKKKREEEWQSVVVRQIIEENTKRGARDYERGMTIEDITTQYITKAQQAKGIELGKDKLQDYEVRRVLQDLLQRILIQQTIEDRYIVVRTEEFSTCRITGIILAKVAANPGKWDAKELRMELRQTIPDDDLFNRAISKLTSTREIYSGPNGKLFASWTHPLIVFPERVVPAPPKKPDPRPDEPEC